MEQIKKEQLAFMDWEMGAFFHFGIRTFYEGHKDWDMKEMPLEGFLPTELDCEQWIHTIKEAGCRYAVLVCKHHDGFANWPSKYTEYSVANTPWKGGKGDVVREFTDACRKYDIRVGLYYSPAQFGSAQMEHKEYDDYFIAQISELLTDYGTIDYLWFDGCGSEGHEYDTERIVREIRRLQPQILIFNMWDPDTKWVGNEAGLVQMPNYNVVNALDFSVLTDQKQEMEAARFLPSECDCRIRLANWFYSEEDEHTLKSVEELLGLYYYSVGRGANLLINIAPDRRGLLPERDAETFLEFGRKVRTMFSNKLADISQAQKKENTYTVLLGEHTLVNHVVVEEKISTHAYVKKFSVYVYPYSYGKRILVYQGTTIGHKHICQIPTVRTQRVELEIDEEYGASCLKDISLYYC